MELGHLYDREVDRCNRCIPFLGAVIWVYQYRHRIAIEQREDEAYREIMATMGDFDAKLANDSTRRARRVMRGQIPGQIASTLLTLGLYLSGYLTPLTLFSAWGIALLIDGAGGAIQGYVHDNRENSEKE